MPTSVWNLIKQRIEENLKEGLSYEERRIKQGYTVGHGGR